MMGAYVGCSAPNPRVKPGTPRIFGKVVGPDGKMLDGVRITTEPLTDAVLTFEGEWEITRSVRTKQPISNGTYTVLPYKLGWWRGKEAAPLKIEYPGQQYEVPDIELVPIDGPTIEDLGAPTDRKDNDESKGAGVVRGDY